jgi:hypothetical protein
MIMQKEGKEGIKERSNRGKKERMVGSTEERGYCQEFRDMPKSLVRIEGRYVILPNISLVPPWI